MFAGLASAPLAPGAPLGGVVTPDQPVHAEQPIAPPNAPNIPHAPPTALAPNLFAGLAAGLAGEGVVIPDQSVHAEQPIAPPNASMPPNLGVPSAAHSAMGVPRVMAHAGPYAVQAHAASYAAAVEHASTMTPAAVLYTSSPYEVAATHTPVSQPREVVDAFKNAWPALNEEGARTMTAQFLTLLGGIHVFNFNLGDIRANTTDVPHTYRQGARDCLTPEEAQASIARGSGLIRFATRQEIDSNHWSCGPGRYAVVYDPPHPASRFRSYNSLLDGAAGLREQYESVERRHPGIGLVNALNRGDTNVVTRILKQTGFIRAPEADYAYSLADQKARLGRIL